MNAKLYALFVDNPEQCLTRAESPCIETREKLCRAFGGEFLRAEGLDPLPEISEIARQEQITQIVVGETHRSRWELFIKGSIML
jgi:two-component system sensor histidine kinase KdpD